MAANVDAPSSSEPRKPQQTQQQQQQEPSGRLAPEEHQTNNMGRMKSSPPPLLASTSESNAKEEGAAKSSASPSSQAKLEGTNSADRSSNNGPKKSEKNASGSHTHPQRPLSETGRRSSAGQNNAAANRSAGKQCCFCWCCCYRCTCLSSRNQEEEMSKSKDMTSKDSWSIDPEMTPSIEEIRCWGDSFDRLMKSPVGRAVFREFLKCEYSEENMLFWLACEDLKKDNNPEVVEEKARLIYEDYISILSPKEVSLDSRVREIVNRNMKDPTPHTFDEAQLQIYTLMHRDSYPRFVNSSYYKKIAQLGMSSRKESSA